MRRTLLAIIRLTDVGRHTVRGVKQRKGRYEQRISVADAIGQIQPQDVGKLVYRVGDDVIQVENNQQRDARKEETA